MHIYYMYHINNMKKQLKIVLLIALSVLIIFGIMIFIYLLPNKPRKLESVIYKYEMENIDNDMFISKDDYGVLFNNVVKEQEEIYLDENIGMYNFVIIGDGVNTTIKYTIKNHNNSTIDEFEYELAFYDSSLVEIDSIILKSQKIPKLTTYDVELKITGNVVGIYKVLPKYPNQSVGKIGGILHENI